jgi:hypothetical protein
MHSRGLSPPRTLIFLPVAATAATAVAAAIEAAAAAAAASNDFSQVLFAQLMALSTSSQHLQHCCVKDACFCMQRVKKIYSLCFWIMDIHFCNRLTTSKIPCTAH